MSTIRRHGVAFHLLPTPEDTLWLEVIREADGVILVSEEYHGADHDFPRAVEEWFDTLVQDSLSDLTFNPCRLCGEGRRQMRQDDGGWLTADYLVEYEFDLCIRCADATEQAIPWVRAFLTERFRPDVDTDDDIEIDIDDEE
jgi:hypothetical protein